MLDFNLAINELVNPDLSNLYLPLAFRKNSIFQ